MEMKFRLRKLIDRRMNFDGPVPVKPHLVSYIGDKNSFSTVGWIRCSQEKKRMMISFKPLAWLHSESLHFKPYFRCLITRDDFFLTQKDFSVLFLSLLNFSFIFFPLH